MNKNMTQHIDTSHTFYIPTMTVESLYAAIKKHHDQKAADRCIDDDTELYAAAGLGPADHRVGDKFQMLQNCARFIDRRCQGGHWPSYAELENRLRYSRILYFGIGFLIGSIIVWLGLFGTVQRVSTRNQDGLLIEPMNTSKVGSSVLVVGRCR